jgi:thioredoxin reductase
MSYDVVVIGAGWFGLASAKTYIELHPTENVLVLESASTCGGTWGQRRLYPGLKSNNLVGTYEYPDFPMLKEIYGVAKGNHVPGAVLHRYLTDYAKKFGVYGRIRFGTHVSIVERLEKSGYRLTTTTSPEEGLPLDWQTLTAKKVIVASGLTSNPNLPQYRGTENFKAPLFHAKDFCKRAPTLENVKRAVVVGGAKSAFDVAYAFVADGMHVDLVIRPNGQGPVWISHPFVTPFKVQLEKLLHLRFLTWFSPCPWGQEDGYPGARRFLHGTRLGRWLVDRFWNILGSDVITANGYNTHPELQKLKPWNSAFWIGSGLSIHNYDSNFFDMVKQGKIQVHIANIDHLEDTSVYLSTGQVLQTDVVVCSTGWKKESGICFKNFGEAGLGLAHSEDEMLQLNKAADEKVLSMFPRLRDQPTLQSEPKKEDPYRMHRFMVPPTRVFSEDLAFAGMVSTVSTAICASIQGLWISAFLDGKLHRVPQTNEEVTEEVMLHTQWGKWRFPCGYGAVLPDLVFEVLPYFDLMLRDLGIKNNRKSGWVSEMLTPYEPETYAGLVDEWKKMQEKLPVSSDPSDT